MPPETTPAQEKSKWNFWETDPKKNFTPKFLAFCGLLIVVGLGIAGYYQYQAYKIWKNLEFLENAKNNPPCGTNCLGRKVIEGDATSTWKTYRNEEYGFEFEYPGKFYLSPTRNTGPLETLISDSTVVYIFINNIYSESKYKKILISNLEAREGESFIEIALHDSKIASFQFDSSNKSGALEVKQILSTFKFIK